MFVIVRHFNVLKTIISSHFLLYEEKNKDKRILRSKKDLSKCSMKLRRRERKRDKERERRKIQRGWFFLVKNSIQFYKY